MLTGRKAFPGETVSDIIASILARDPDWDALPEQTPLKVRDLLRRCLRREPHRRLRDIGDARIEIEESLVEPAAVFTAPRSMRGVPLVAALLAAAVVGGLAIWGLLRPAAPEPRRVYRFDINLPAEEALTHLNDPVVALSPEESHLVYAGGSPTRLYIRPRDRGLGIPLQGTEGALTAFFAPDGKWVGFYGGGKLKKIQLASGVVETICDAPDGWGASWGDDDTILFSPTAISGLFRVSASGGLPSAMTTPDSNKGETSHRWPELLPGSNDALFTIWTGSPETSQIALLSLVTGEHRVIIEGASFARYSSTGHLVYARQGQLWAAPFDLRTRETEQ